MPSATVQPDARLTSKLINPVLSSVIETFAMMLDCRVERGEVELLAEGAEPNDVSALIGVTGRAKGLVCIGFHQQTALNVAERFIGQRPSGLTLEATDALGELVNMVGGAAKSKLNMGLNIGLPQVSDDPDQPIDFPPQSKPIRVHFDSDLGPFNIDFGFTVRN